MPFVEVSFFFFYLVILLYPNNMTHKALNNKSLYALAFRLDSNYCPFSSVLRFLLSGLTD